MAKRKKNKEQDQQEIVNVSKAEHYVENNIQKILIGIGAIIATAFIVIFISNMGRHGERKAEEAAITAQKAFEQNDWKTALEGDGVHPGFITIATDYPKSRIGNLAHYYAGVSYMKQNNYEQAAEQLKQFSDTEDPNINGLAHMNLGDAYSELDQKDEALKQYKRAANSNSEAFEADLLVRYGMAQLNNNDFDGAKNTFTKVVDQFPNTTQANSAEQYLAGL